jgi:hypothetical protein
MPKRGRPTYYRPLYAEPGERFCAVTGTTDVDIAEFFNVAVSTIYEWE